MPKSPQLHIVVVNYNTKLALRDCLASLHRVSHELPFRVTVVDNASSDGSRELLRTEFPEVNRIENHENLGFAQAVNQALNQSDEAFTFLLNPDTWVPPGALTKLWNRAISDSKIAVTGAALHGFNGDVQGGVLAGPNLWKELFNLWPEVKALIPDTLIQVVRNRRRTRRGEAIEAPAVSGGAMLFRTKVVRESGGFDPRFFVYHEEVDLCLRLSKQGWRIVFEPEARILHHNALSTGFKPDRLPSEPVLGWRLRGTKLLFQKHHSSAAAARFARLASSQLMIRAFLNRIVSGERRSIELLEVSESLKFGTS